MRVEIWSFTDVNSLHEAVNGFLEYGHYKSIVDIKLSTSPYGASTYYSAMVIYEEKGE